MSYIFLTENYSEGPTTYYAIAESKIETLKLADTYDRFGQIVGNTNAGDYSIQNNDYSDAYHEMLKAVREKFNILEDQIFDIDVDDLTATEEIGVDAELLKSFCENWCKENETFNTVEGFDYWDGHNWKTVITACEFGEPSHQIVEDEKLVKQLNEAIENRSFEKKGFGKEIYTAGEYAVIDSNVQGTWASYELIPLNEVELEDLN